VLYFIHLFEGFFNGCVLGLARYCPARVGLGWCRLVGPDAWLAQDRVGLAWLWLERPEWPEWPDRTERHERLERIGRDEAGLPPAQLADGIAFRREQLNHSRRVQMKVCVIVKLVPDTEAKIQIKAGDATKIDDSEISFIINPYDEYAVEEAVKIADEKDAETTVLTVGPKESDAAIRHALAMGIENAVHILDSGESDAFRTACLIQKWIEGKGFDLVLCGRQAIDDDMGAVGAILGELLGIAQVLIVTKIDLSADNKKAVCKRDVEGGAMTIETPLPAVISCQKGLNEPRVPSIIDIKRANKKTVEMVDPKACPGFPSTLKVRIGGLVMPPPRTVGRVIEGDPASAAREVVRLLRDEAKVI